ncbi:aldo/keto reductase [Marinitenerispora sediminis]|uniref:Aldo/keto reductase n=1 Tax=Marinitenerispora sediminis TaxID=1931232 RepID=A0A368T6U4_9ACTN|nr:aldo/keto reductase [Marinitenerispora sediminis]RCV48314.1 aldo/keto reductase [Marinitenerispora sediminis]RCV49431.1 aldo/keto reductase [Marinitenerispora sediminis]RCV59235.1 aldo/keto reductase [Marinitenerispora sediminis]
MRTRVFAPSGRDVGAIGLGCMGMSWAYSESQRDDDQSVALVRAALDLGVTFLDTADVYGDGHNESLVGRALRGRRDEAVLATKVGLVVDDLATKSMRRDASPARVRRAVEASLRRLGTDVIDLYYLHRVDPEVPLEETWEAMAALVAQGKVRHLGLSEVSVAEAERAHAVHPVAAVQSELSLWTRTPLGPAAGPAAAGTEPGGAPGRAGGGLAGASGDVVGWCAAHGAAFVPFAPLGRGFLTGAVTGETSFEPGDFRAGNPRFAPAARDANLRIVEVLRTVAERHGATPAQVALAWVLAQGEHVVPIPGTKRPAYLRENAAAAELRLTDGDLAELRDAPAAVGTRY